MNSFLEWRVKETFCFGSLFSTGSLLKVIFLAALFGWTDEVLVIKCHCWLTKQIIEHNIMKIVKLWHYIFHIIYISVYFSGSNFSNVRVCCWNSTVWIQIETLNLRDKSCYWIHGKIIERLVKKWFVWTQIMTWQRHPASLQEQIWLHTRESCCINYHINEESGGKRGEADTPHYFGFLADMLCVCVCV